MTGFYSQQQAVLIISQIELLKTSTTSNIKKLLQQGKQHPNIIFPLIEKKF